MSRLAEQLDKIVRSLGSGIDPASKARLEIRLHFAEEMYEVLQGEGRTKTTPADLVRRLKAIEKACATLRIHLGNDRSEAPPGLSIVLQSVNLQTREAGFPVLQAIDAARRDLPIIEQASREAVTRIDRSRPKGRGGARHYGNIAVQELVPLLIEAYEDATGRPAGVSTDAVTGRRRGPLVRFLSCCLKALGIELDAEQIRGYVVRYRDNQSQ